MIATWCTTILRYPHQFPMNVVNQKLDPSDPGAKTLSRLPWFRAKDLIDEVVLGGAAVSMLKSGSWGEKVGKIANGFMSTSTRKLFASWKSWLPSRPDRSIAIATKQPNVFSSLSILRWKKWALKTRSRCARKKRREQLPELLPFRNSSHRWGKKWRGMCSEAAWFARNLDRQVRDLIPCNLVIFLGKKDPEACPHKN